MRKTDIWTSHLDAQTLIEIGQEQDGPCASLFLPVSGLRDGADARDLAALVSSAHDLMSRGPRGPRRADSILHPARTLVGSARLWESGARGIAVFASPFMFAVILTGLHLRRQAVVARRFATRPLVPALDGLTDYEIRSALSTLSERAPGRVLVDAVDIVSAAHRGAIDDLYLDSETQLWGTYDHTTSTVVKSDGSGPNADELMDLAAVKTLSAGGRVHVLDRLPAGGGLPGVLAVLAWPHAAPSS